MASFDGGGSAQRDPPAGGGGAAGTPPDHDPARLVPPADPWLTEAPTSAAPLPEFGEIPPDDPVPFDGGVPMRPGGARRRRRVPGWVLAILAAAALFAATTWAGNRVGSGGDGAAGPAPSTAATTGSRPGAAATPGPSATAGATTVVYEVTASGSRNTGSVTYTDRDGEIIRLHGIHLPWRITFPAGGRKPLVLLAQRKSGGDTGPVTCTITVDGKLLSSTTAHGRYASAQCSGSG
jgi:hypothetical protein